MSLINLEMYDALKAAGTPESEARTAAEVAGAADLRLITMAERLNGLDSKLTWIGATMISLITLSLGTSLAVAWQVLQLTAKLPL